MTQMPVQQVLDAAVRLHQTGKLSEAEALYREILTQHPNHADALHLLGVLATQAGQHELAVELINKAIAINPDFPVYFNNLGSALLFLGRFDEAAVAFRSALRLKPDYAQAHCNLGNVLKDQNQLQQAIESYQSALKINPVLAEVHNNLGNVFQALGRAGDAVDAYRHAIKLKPDYVQALNNLGVALSGMGSLDAGIAAYREALRLKPDHAEAFTNLGNALKDQGSIQEALDAYRTSFQLRPEFAQVHSNYVYTLYFLPGCGSHKIHTELADWNQRHAAPLKNSIQPHANNPNPKRKLRVGYVSPDFRSHVIGRNLLPLLENHDRKRFRIFCFSNVTRPDSLTERFKTLCDNWIDITTISDEKAAQIIRDNNIDILVDLTMHMANNRLLIFARKPAPVQITFMGYPGTTGMDAIDYRFTDPYLDPPESDVGDYSEKTVRLPDTFWCYQPQTDESRASVLGINDLPASKNGFITFGCLNNFSKFNDKLLKIFSQLLTQVSGSRLIILAPAGVARQRVLGKFGRDGIAPERIEFSPFLLHQEYLQLYHRVDISLDTVPYNGHTTSLDSLWMGVPVVTLIGETIVGRAGFSQLCNLGLRDLAVRTPGEFVTLAAALARDLPRLTELRRTLRKRMEKSPLMDAKRFTTGVESAYRNLWRQFCDDALNRVENT